MRSYLTDRPQDEASSPAEYLLRIAVVLAVTAVLFGSLYLGIKFLE